MSEAIFRLICVKCVDQSALDLSPVSVAGVQKEVVFSQFIHSITSAIEHPERRLSQSLKMEIDPSTGFSQASNFHSLSPDQRRERFRSLDKDGDGQITEEEFGSHKQFVLVDLDQDGVLTEEEYISLVHAPGLEASSLSHGESPESRGSRGFAPPPSLTMARIKSSLMDLPKGAALDDDLRRDLEAVRDTLSTCVADGSSHALTKTRSDPVLRTSGGSLRSSATTRSSPAWPG